jgi:hypothetical protein
MPPSADALLQSFRRVFENRKYLHRHSTVGDTVASCLFEDLLTLGKSQKLVERIRSQERVVNTSNVTVGFAARRGDGTFGELVPAGTATLVGGFSVARGPVATIEIGVEAKILAKAMIKQIDRVIGDLARQAAEFRRRGGTPLCVGLVGVNFAQRYTSFEGQRAFPTDGKKYKHPIQEAAEAAARLEHRAKKEYDEFLILKFVATNEEPFPFAWVDEEKTRMGYSALLTRVSREYDRRF